MAAPSFSRLQLAAALIEYDNDADDPEGPYRLARESAIFAHTRRSTSRPTGLSGLAGEGEGAGFRKSKADFLNVKLPSELDAQSERRSLSSGRRTPALSQKAGLGPRGQEVEEEEVDLAEWGLAKKPEEGEEDDDDEEDAFEEPERRRVVSEFLPGPSSLGAGLAGTLGVREGRRVSMAQSELIPQTATFQQKRARRSSLGDFGAGGAFLDAAASPATGAGPGAGGAGPSRPASILGPAAGRRSFTEPLGQHRRNSLAAMSLSDAASLRNPFSPVDGPVPFPSTETPAAADSLDKELENPFALPPPSPSKSSRFDPKAHGRTLSTASMGSTVMFSTGEDRRSSMYLTAVPEQDDRSTLAYFSDARSSRYMDPDDARSSRYFPAEDGKSTHPSLYLREDELGDDRSRRLSGYNVLRPKVLVMPSPLQNEELAAQQAQDLAGRGGFVHSKDGPPLPPGAKAERPVGRPMSSMTLNKTLDGAGAGGGGGPNPRSSLTLSQLTFRNSLMNDVSYVDMGLRRAGAEGEKVTQEVEDVDELEEARRARGERAPGALYGRSLIDDLEARKAALRGRQRVFQGDDRPAMMDRQPPAQQRRSSTLIDPAAFDKTPGPARPGLTRQGTNVSTGSGRGGAGGAPLLNFEGEDTLTSPLDPTGAGAGRISKTRSTFGVDQIWEKELAKLQAIEAEERKAEVEERRREEELERKRGKKGKGKGPALASPPLGQGVVSPPARSASLKATSSVLPTHPQARPPRHNALLNDSHRRESAATLGVNNWFNSDDDEDTSEGERAELMSPKKQAQGGGRGYHGTPQTLPPSLPSLGHQMEDSSEEEDVPLAARMQHLAVTGLPPHLGGNDDESEEELPLAAVIAKKQMARSTSSKPGSLASGKQGSGGSPRVGASFATPTKARGLPTFDFGGLADGLGLGGDDESTPTKTTAAATTPTATKPTQEESDEDDVPLGVRHPTAALRPPTVMLGASSDEDEAPLGMRFPQAAMQQHAQAQALQQQQYMQMMMQQQQMMWQAEQMRGSMVFPTAPSPMGMPGPMAPPMPGYGMPYGAVGAIPPSVSDPGKFNRVDQWRRGVGVDEQ